MYTYKPNSLQIWVGRVCIFLLIVLFTLILGMEIGVLQVFEDGSWGIGVFPYILKGCFPWGICN